MSKPTKSAKSAKSAKITSARSAARPIVRATNQLAQALQKTSAAMPKINLSSPRRLNQILIAAWVVVIAVALFYFRGQFIVATVNGQPIFRSALISSLELRYGKETLDTLVLETLVRQEAAAKKISVTNDELEAEVQKLADNLKSQSQDLDQLLSLEGMTRDSLKDQLKLQLLVEKMVDKSTVAVTDEEVAKYLTENKAYLPKDAKPETLAPEVKAQLEQQKLSAKTQELLKELQTRAKINNWLFKTKPAGVAPAEPTTAK